MNGIARPGEVHFSFVLTIQAFICVYAHVQSIYRPESKEQPKKKSKKDKKDEKKEEKVHCTVLGLYFVQTFCQHYACNSGMY